MIISGDREGRLFLWQVQQPQQQQSQPLPQQLRHQHSGNSSSQEPLVQRHGLYDGHGRDAGIKCCCFSADGRFAATGANDGSISVWDVSGPVPQLMATSYVEPSLAGDGEEGDAAISGGEGASQQQHSQQQEQHGSQEQQQQQQQQHEGSNKDKPQVPVQVRPLSNDAVLCCCLSADGSVLAAGAKGGKVGVWSGAQRVLLELPHRHAEGSKVRTCALSPDARKLVTGGDDARVLLWDLDRGAALLAVAEHNRPVRAVAVSADGCRIAACGDDSLITVLDIALLTCYSGYNGTGGPSVRAGAWMAAPPRLGAAQQALKDASLTAGRQERGPAAGDAGGGGRATGGGGAVAGGAHPFLNRIRISDGERLLACALVDSVHVPVPAGSLGVLGPRPLAAAGPAGAPTSCGQPILCMEQGGQVREGFSGGAHCICPQSVEPVYIIGLVLYLQMCC